MRQTLNICTWKSPNELPFCGLYFKIHVFIQICNANLTGCVWRDNESREKKTPPAGAAGWTAPRWCYEKPFKAAPLPRWSKAELRRTATRHGPTICMSEKKKPQLDGLRWNNTFGLWDVWWTRNRRSFSFCPRLCRTWRLRLHWSNLNQVHLRQ